MNTSPAPSTTPGDFESDVIRLAEALTMLTKTTRRELGLPMGVSSLSALATVMEHGPMRLGDLAAWEGVTPATLSRVVAALEQGGFARKVTDPSDARSAFLEITTRGVQAVTEVRRARAAVLRARLAALSQDDRRALLAALPALEALAGA